jgi:hypothetical protein
MLFIFFIHLFICAYTVGPFLPSASHPLHFPLTPLPSRQNLKGNGKKIAEGKRIVKGKMLKGKC